MKKEFRRNIDIIIFFVLINLALFYGIFSKEGIIINRDFNFPVFKENFIRYYYPLWNDITSQPNFEQIIRLPLRFFLFPLYVSISLKLLIYFAYLLTSLSTYLYLSEVFNKKERIYTPICGSLIFTFSLPLLQFMWEISLVYSIGVLPLLLWSSHKFSKEKSFKWIFLASLCLLISTGHPFLLAMNVFLFLLYNMLLLNRNWNYIFLTITIFLLLFLWYILPYSHVSLSPTQLGREPLSKGTFDYISDNNIFKILTLARDKFLYIQTVPENEVLTNVWYFFLSLPFFILSLPLFFINKIERKQIKTVFFFFYIYLSTTLLSFGSKGPLGEIYWYVVSSTSIGWIFRSPLKFQLYQAFAYSILFAMGLLLLWKLARKKILTLVLAVTILLGTSGYTLWYANTKDMTPITIPDEFYQINDILQNIPDNSKVIWYPRYNERPTIWLDRPVAPFDMKSSKKDTYSTIQTYNHVVEYLYTKIYPKELKKPEYYDFLRAIGVKYLAFHNDRNLTLDKTALNNIMDTLGNKSLIYNSNNWFLFNLSIANPRIYLTNNIILSENIKLSKYGAILIPDNNLNKTDLSTVELLNEKNIPKNFREKNIIINPSYENGTFSWYVPKSTIYQVTTNSNVIDGNNSLKIATNNTKRGWLFIKSSEIRVTSQETYMLQAYMRYFNMNGSHIKVEGFDTNENKWKDIFFLIMSHFGYSEWQQYIGYLDVPKNVNEIRIVLAAGWIHEPLDGEGIVEYDNINMLCLSELFPSVNSSLNIFSEKTSPTLWKVKLNVSQPSMLIFTESYDSSWACHVNGNKISSIPVYGVVNGFWISQTGQLEITIEYEPQRWFYMGSAISIATLIACTIYLTHDWTRNKAILKRLKKWSRSNSS